MNISLIYILVILVLWVYLSLAIMKIAQKTKNKNAWLAWIPVVNLLLLTDIAKVSSRWLIAPLAICVIAILNSLLSTVYTTDLGLGIAIGFITFFGFVIVSVSTIAFFIWLWWKIFQAANKPGWWSVLNIIPGVGLVTIGLAAWAD